MALAQQKTPLGTGYPNMSMQFARWHFVPWTESYYPQVTTSRDAQVHTFNIGGDTCYRQARDTLYWPCMQAEIKGLGSNCSTCNEFAHN